MRTASTRPSLCVGVAGGAGTGTSSAFNQQVTGVFDVFLDLDEELDCFAAVDDAVIVGERDHHYRPDDDLAADRDGTIRDLMEAEDADLRRVEDRGAEQRPEDAAVGDGEGAAGQILERQRAVV